MKRTLFTIILTLLFVSTILIPNTLAQDEPYIQIAESHAGGVESVAFSPDGNTHASGGGLTVHLWDAHTGELLNTLTGHKGVVNSVAFHLDGNILASGSDDETIRLWDVNTGELLNTLTGHTNGVESIMFSPDGNTLASSGGYSIIYLWDVNTGELLNTLTAHTGFVNSIAFSPDGQTLVSGGGLTVRLWNANTGELLHTLEGHTDNVNSVAFSLDGNTLASGGWDGTIRLWDANTGKLLKTLTQNPKNVNDSLLFGLNFVNSIEFSPDGNTLTSGGNDDTIRIWDVNSGELLNTLTGPTWNLKSIAFSPDGQTLASSGGENVRLWDAHTGELLNTLTEETEGVETLRLWDANTGEHLTTLTFRPTIKSVAFSPDGSMLAGGSSDSTIHLWDAHTGEQLKTLTRHKRVVNTYYFGENTIAVNLSGVNSVTFSSDGSTLASGGGNTVHLWDANTGELLNTLAGHTEIVNSVVFSRDGNTLASSGGLTVRLWDVNSGELLNTLTGHARGVNSVAFSRDGNTLASGGDDDTIRLWDVNSGALLSTLTGHTDPIESVAFSPDGNTLASGSQDGTIILWDANTKETLKTFDFTEDTIGFSINYLFYVESVAFSPDGQTLASGNSFNTILLWELDTPPHVPPDDHSDTRAAATPLLFGIDEAREGVIDSNTDVDYFKVEISQPRGVLKFYTLGGGLDAIIELQDSTGSVLPADDSIEYGVVEVLRLSHEVRAGTYYVKVTGTSENNTEITYRLRAEFTPISDDHSDTRVNATPLTLSSPMGGWLSPADVDYFSVEVSRSGTLNLHIPESLATVIELQDSTGMEIELQDGTDYTLMGAGTYYVNVTGSSVSTTGSYTLHASFTPNEPMHPTVSLSESSDHVAPGEAFTLDATLENIDGISAEATLQLYGPVKIVLTNQQTPSDTLPGIDFTDKALGEAIPIVIVEMGADSTHKETITVTAPETDGTYAYKVCIEQIDSAGDTIKTCSEIITVRVASLDLHLTGVMAIPATVAPGKEVKLYATVRNSGNKSDKTALWFHLQNEDTKPAKGLGGFQIDPLPMADGTTAIRKYITVTAPDKPGTYTYTASVDSVEGEENTDNNSAEITVTVGAPDLVIMSMSASDTELQWNRDDPIYTTLSITIKNIGTVKSNSTRLRVYRSANQHISEDDAVIGNPDLKALNPQEEVTLEFFTKVEEKAHPELINPPTIYYYGASVDSPSNEINSDNNWSKDIIVRVYVTQAGVFALNVPSNFISDVAYSNGYTYFLLTAQFLKIRKQDSEDDPELDYDNKNCTIRLHLPPENISDQHLENPAYFMFYVEVPAEELRNIAQEGAKGVFKNVIFSVIGELAGKIVESVGGIFFASFTTGMQIGELIVDYTDTQAAAEAQTPTVVLEDPEKSQLCFLIVPGRLKNVEISVLQDIRIKDTSENRQAFYRNTWNLEEMYRLENPDLAAAPDAHNMSLTDFPLFQHLPPELQTYILQYFGEIANPNTLNPEVWQIPEKTTLLANYPNPFNPETWIPYQLAQPADVKLTIYDINGHVVRDLDLGHQVAGIYRNRKRAAHWDGKNAQGEPVASGVYFYTLKAGDWTATRKMLIRK